LCTYLEGVFSELHLAVGYPVRRNRGLVAQGGVVLATGGSKPGKWLSSVVVFAAVLLASGCTSASAQEVPQEPNFVFILTDDQDTPSLSRMPALQAELKEKGTTFENAFFAEPRCCPSRVSMLRGQYPHNHGIMHNFHGAQTFRSKGLDEDTLATWLYGAGYRTALIGKYLNGYDSLYIPPGWDVWRARMGGGTSIDLNENGTKRSYPGKHMDFVLKEKALAFIESSLHKPQPFFLLASFEAPHLPATYQNAYAPLFKDAELPMSPSFNEADISDKARWLQEKPLLTPKQVKGMRADYRDRLRSLQTVDGFV
jgi:N-acetylglucosamine-6-sulfatase